MTAHLHDPSPSTVPQGLPAADPAIVPVFVDVTGRRHRLVRRCGVLLATGSLVYLPLVAATLLSGAGVPAHRPPLPDDARLETSDQPAAMPFEVDGPEANGLVEEAFPAPEQAVPLPPEVTGRPGPDAPPAPVPPVAVGAPSVVPPPSDVPPGGGGTATPAPPVPGPTDSAPPSPGVPPGGGGTATPAPSPGPTAPASPSGPDLTLTAASGSLTPPVLLTAGRPA
ncbi:hypothetical protein NCC78_21800 [Micromonospora phytophila]|uniref:hypothetical protein n=1 Tax=Micromonospora phytophila TaxID=709888 RepID=UPI00202F10F7|nr:hypothetical protein [Micromonospora phytophila]MCM0677302.1 hypothetical protein [Micromonospora phytophila]